MTIFRVNDVRTVVGTPKESDFASKQGTPIVIDTNTGFAYFLRGAEVLPLQTAPPSSVGAFDSGFDAGYS
jgi:hypothetical protein